MNELDLSNKSIISIDMVHTAKGFSEESAIDNRRFHFVLGIKMGISIWSIFIYYFK
jgi:hypothetical protein